MIPRPVTLSTLESRLERLDAECEEQTYVPIVLPASRLMWTFEGCEARLAGPVSPGEGVSGLAAPGEEPF